MKAAGPRSVGERQGDGFAETMRQARTSLALPTHGGDRTHIVATRNYHDLRTGIGTACLDVVGDITAAETRLLARDCCVIPMVLPIHDESKRHLWRTITIPDPSAIIPADLIKA